METYVDYVMIDFARCVLFIGLEYTLARPPVIPLSCLCRRPGGSPVLINRLGFLLPPLRATLLRSRVSSLFDALPSPSSSGTAVRVPLLLLLSSVVLFENTIAVSFVCVVEVNSTLPFEPCAAVVGYIKKRIFTNANIPACTAKQCILLNVVISAMLTCSTTLSLLSVALVVLVRNQSR